MLTQMIEPGIMLEEFDIASRHGNILKDTPLRMRRRAAGLVQAAQIASRKASR